jgi:hypothetical protein
MTPKLMMHKTTPTLMVISITRRMQAAVQCGVHPPIVHIQRFTRSQWMQLLGKFPRRITPAAAKVIGFGCKHKNTNRMQLLAGYLTVDRS